jgi:ribose/xylose/arabinose/galactoside ABC-type transport system permease subunit
MHGLKFGGLFKAKKMETDGVQKAGFMERFVQLTRSSAFQRLVPFIALAALILVYSILAPLRFPTAMNAQYILIQSVAIMVVAFGSTLIVISGSIDLSVGSVAALSGMSGALVANQHGAVFGILAAVATGAIAGLINRARNNARDFRNATCHCARNVELDG